MQRVLFYFVYHPRAAWATVAALSLLMGVLVAATDINRREDQRVSILQTEARRSSIEIMSSTLNGNLMGSITLLGLTDRDIKQEVSNGLMSVDANIPVTLSTLGNSFEAEGVFTVGEDGIVKSSWDRINKPSTGLDVKFRPYYRSAMKGQSSVYAAISMARGDRSLYFTAPVYTERARATSGIGAVVARTNLDRVDALLKGRFDHAFLLSPQGVVFASTNQTWVGMLEGVATPERLKAIRDLKQFGPLFDNTDPEPLPVVASAGIQGVDGQRFAVGIAPVHWNDPSGDWTLIVMEDLAQSAAPGRSLAQGAATSALGVLLGWMWVHLLRGRRSQDEATAQLQAYARQQEQQAQFRARLANTSMRLQRCETLQELASVFLLETRDMLGVAQGVVYAVRPDTVESLELIGSSASGEPPPATLALGEGLLGQCAQERRTQLVLTPAAGYWTVRSGLGNAQPAALMMAPLVLHEALIGAVELAVLQAPQENALSQLEEMVALLANSMDILRRNLLLQRLNQTPVEPALAAIP